MPNEIKKLPYALSVAAGQSDNMKRKSISQSSPTALIWTISGIILVACGGGSDNSRGSRNTSRILGEDDLIEDEDDYDIRGTLGFDDPVLPTDLAGDPDTELVGDYGTLEFVDLEAGEWIYTAYDTATQAAQFREKVTETFTFTNADSTETEQVVITVTITLLDDEEKETNIGLSYDPNIGIIATSTETGLYTIRSVVSDGKGTESIENFSVILFPDVTNLSKVLGNGGVNAAIGDKEATSHQFLLGGDNAQTLNAGEGGDVIFGGRGDDIINLGNGSDIVLYRYDGTNKANLVAYDGSDVINNFSLGEDVLFLAHTGVTGSASDIDTATAFLAALKGVSLLVDESGDITGVVFTFTDRADGAGVDDEIDLTVKFDEAFAATNISSNLDTFFAAAASGERVIIDGQEVGAYEALVTFNDENSAVFRPDFMDLGFELNNAETDIV